MADAGQPGCNRLLSHVTLPSGLIAHALVLALNVIVSCQPSNSANKIRESDPRERRLSEMEACGCSSLPVDAETAADAVASADELSAEPSDDLGSAIVATIVIIGGFACIGIGLCWFFGGWKTRFQAR